ncbi:cation-independent mannose-6-phosphate receptor [Oryzias latipes]|uniref:Insulin-like growth factor 2 receptor n=1 Tax=Oryzias latipes TaxID=8090 RepID=A0A3B3INQ7_ORYLA|nr:cation-independent mannose-6-phosphate receptor [Oryzias latipes]
MSFGLTRSRQGSVTLVLWFAACLGFLPVRFAAEEDLWYQDLCSYKWEAMDQDEKVKYTLSLCPSSEPTSCGPNAAVCAQNLRGATAQSVGDRSQERPSGSVLDFNSTLKCPDGGSNIRTSISFQCGTTLGSPEFVAFSQCVHYFEWKTYTACKKDKFKPHKEVPCYIFDSDGKKHDLSPLIKLKDGYLVDDGDDGFDFYINVCRSIYSTDKPCPEGSAACLVTGEGSFSMGLPAGQLEHVNSDSLRLQYALGEGSTPPSRCGEHAPAVTITFICPSRRRVGSPPKMTSNQNCRYEVEWVTEYACHRDYLESNSCRLTGKQHDISIDLTPLTTTAGEQQYHAHSGTSGGPDSYIFYLNICGKVATDECGDDQFVSSCQVKTSSSVSKVAGRFQNQTLRYSDGDLTLIYPGGTSCSSGFQRMTIINFQCSKNATGSGKGNPVFAGETDCTYYFNWETAFACVREEEDLLCRVTDGRKHYDLSPLTRYPESDSSQNWEVKDAKSTKSSSHYFLNVCHKVIRAGGAAACPEDASICAVDKNNKSISLGSFLSPPSKTRSGDDIRLVYTDGSPCPDKRKIQSILTLRCKPGAVESPPVLVSVSSDECFYELEWFTAAACILSKTQGDSCRVGDPQAGFSFDLSPLSKPDGGFYNLTDGTYTYLINVCGPVKTNSCPDGAGACQVEKSSWSLGEANSRLSYYDGLIQLTYRNGSQYNNKEHTGRSTLISFLCDPEAGLGKPDFQVEDNYTYNFHWYTSLACPERSHQCLVTDPRTLDQYDLSSLSRSTRNWLAMDLSDPQSRKSYYINICRAIVPVVGCDREASVCEMTYVTQQGSPKEVVSVSNMGVSKKGPVIEGRDRLLLEFTDGSACTSEGLKLSYTTRIHLICSRGSLSMPPRFESTQNCTSTFIWETQAACAIRTTEDKNQTCSVVDPNTGFEYNLQLLASKTGYNASANGKDFLLNICSDAPGCGEGMAGCELDSGKPVSPVGVTKTLQYSTDGKLKLTYRGPLVESTGTRDTFTINFVCDPNPHPNPLELLREEMSTMGGRTTHDAVFSFYTALACTPAPVDCSISDALGNEYDLSRLIRDEEDSPWIPMDTDAGAGRRFYINVCKPLPALKDCPVGPLGACGLIHGRSVNLGYVQSMPQMAEDGAISIVYQNGDQCGAASRYSTRIIFQCDDSPGSPMFDRQDGCEFVFVWRTSEACPIRRSKGENCQVQDPRSGFQFDLSSLKGRDFPIRSQEYVYHLSVCGPLQKDVCSHGESVSSCQVNGDRQKIAGMANQNLVFVGDQILLNYTNGETCHKIYQRSTLISFSCHPDAGPGEPEFIKETPDCSYLFTWPTALACAKTISCSYNDDQGRSYDLSPLALDSGNWEAELPTQGTERRFFMNVCRSLVQQAGPWKCPSGAASCMKDGDKFLSLGRVESSPQLDGKVLKLQYTSGQPCPDGRRNRSSIIRFKCDKDRVDSRPTLISQIQDCVFTFLWLTAAACPLNTTQHGDCRVTNPTTGHLFDLSSLKKEGAYTIPFDPQPNKSVIHMNVCGGVDNTACPSGSAVCFLDAGNSVSGGQVSQKLSFRDGEVELTYDEGSRCAANPELKHKSVIHFICRPAQMSTAPPEPVLISSDPQTCTHFFSFYTHLVCEKQVTCSVHSGSTLIDLTPLIHVSGFYTAEDEAVGQSANSTDFYINICQPLNSIPGVACPPGAAVCMDPVDGPPVDIGRTTKGPEVNKDTSEVSITYSSSTPCTDDPAQNYTSTIIFSCQRGTDLGSPQMLRQQGCVFLFEWETPLVCPDATNSSGCQLTDAQLQFTFDLQSLSEDVTVTAGSGTYHLHMCGAVKDPACKQSAVCLVSGSGSNRSATSFGISKAMSMDFRHEEQALLMQYGGGDQCPAVSAKRQTSIFFKCDRSAGRGSPQLLAETKGCSTDFQWDTSAVCPPIKMECKLVSKHQTFDLRSLSSLTKPWRFKHQRYSYFINLCQGIHGGVKGCPEDASVCRRSAGGLNQTLGRVYTQKMSYEDKQISIRYTAGDEVCGNQVKASALIQLTCGSTVGQPSLVRVDEASCLFVFHWETRSACAVKQQEVKMVNGTIRVPETGASLSLGAVYFSYHQASGDIRPNGDRYIYHIQLSGITNSSLYSCEGANICQDKLNATYRRRIGNSTEAQYYVKGGNLDVIIPSNSKCGRIEAKKVSSTIMFQCSPSAGVGIPEFMLETDECQYLFVWHTDAVCGLIAVERETDDGGSGASLALSQRSQAVGGVLGLLLLGLTVCLLGLLLYKRERRELVMQKVSSCCRRGNQLSYKYSKVNTDEEGGEEEMEWLMEEVDAPDSSASAHHRSNHSNGHVRTKRVNTDALRPFSMDEQEDDSEDEVLSIPGVRVHKPSRSSAPQRSPFLQEESDEDLVGLLEDSDGKSKGRKPPPSGLTLGKNRHKADEEDSDEDLLRV